MDLISILIGDRIEIMTRGKSSLSVRHTEYDSLAVSQFSQHDATRVKVFVQELKTRGVWRMGKPSSSLRDSLAGLRSLASGSSELGGGHAGYNYCEACKTTISEIAGIILDRVMASVAGLCLDCVVQEGKAVYCRVEH